MHVEGGVSCGFKESALLDLKGKLYDNRDISKELWAQTGNDLNVSST
jgi:hypothetical protein